MTEEVKLKVSADTKQAEKELNRFTKTSKKNFDNIKVSLKTLAVGFAGVTVAVGKMVQIYGVQERAEKKLNAVLKATNNVVGLTSNELKKMASELQNVTEFGDETILSAQAMLLTFKEIGGEVFPRALETASDLASFMGTDMTNASLLLGKALNDPIVGVTALQRNGIKLTDVQKDMIKNFMDMNDVASAQGIILDEIEGQIGGFSKAMGETLSGSVKQATNSMGDLIEAIGKRFAPLVKDIAKGLKIVANNLAEVMDTTVKKTKPLQTTLEEQIDIVQRLSSIKLDDLQMEYQKLAKEEKKVVDQFLDFKNFVDAGFDEESAEIVEMTNYWEAYRQKLLEAIIERKAMDEVAKSEGLAGTGNDSEDEFEAGAIDKLREQWAQQRQARLEFEDALMEERMTNFQDFNQQEFQMLQSHLGDMFFLEYDNNQARMKLDEIVWKNKIKMTKSGLKLMSGLMNTNSRKLFEIGKASAIAEATISGFQGVAKTLGTYPFPFNIPLAAAHGAIAIAQVQKIASTSFNGGGGGMTISGGGAGVSTPNSDIPSINNINPQENGTSVKIVVIDALGTQSEPTDATREFVRTNVLPVLEEESELQNGGLQL